MNEIILSILGLISTSSATIFTYLFTKKQSEKSFAAQLENQKLVNENQEIKSLESIISIQQKSIDFLEKRIAELEKKILELTKVSG